MDERHGLDGTGTAKGCFYGFRFDDLPPWRLYLDRGASTALDDGGQARSEDAIDSNKDRIAWLDQIDDRRFHPGRACAGDRDCEAIRRREYLSEEFLNVIHHLKKGRIEVSKKRGRQSTEHAWMDHAGARTQEDSMRWK